MKNVQLFFSVLTTLCLLSFAYQPAFSQANSGSNPELVFSKYYSGIGGGQPVSEVGDSIGNLRFRAMTAKPPVTWRDGASITSRITGPFNADSLPANLIFRTGAVWQMDRMAITSDGLVGIGTLDPAFNLHTVGNTHTTGDFFGRIHFDDNQGTNAAPNTYIDEAYFELKQRNILGVPAGMGNMGGLFSLAPGGTSHDHQLFFANDGIFHRRWDGDAASWAGSTWYKLLSGEDINGTPNRIAKFTGPTALGDSQLWDDGTRVGIGTDSPTAGFLLDVNGNSRIGGNILVTGTSTLNGAATVGGLFTANNSANVTGDLSVTNDATISADLDVMGGAHVDGVVTIGTNNMPISLDAGATNISAYHLYVEGGILSEEVRVRNGWADYVFESDYQLLSLEEVEHHIEEKGYLHNTPSAQEIESNGLDLGESTVNQQEKIEEIFLHLIEINKEVKNLKEENAALKARLEKFENQ